MIMWKLRSCIFIFIWIDFGSAFVSIHTLELFLHFLSIVFSIYHFLTIVFSIYHCLYVFEKKILVRLSFALYAIMAQTLSEGRPQDGNTTLKLSYWKVTFSWQQKQEAKERKKDIHFALFPQHDIRLTSDYNIF